jgi:protein-S-isoprenylcysteine O-methyltransferase Ste14
MILVVVRRLAMIVSASFATVGYTVESRRYGSPILAVETNLLGWLVCLACYPPLNQLPSLLITGRFWQEYRLFPAGSLPDNCCAVLGGVFLLVHTWTIAVQGKRFANLTYRGTISHGPFSLVRHPQYATKMLWWLFEWLPFFGSPLNAVFFCGWVSLYVGRGLTEERFLSRFPDYREYKRRVRCRFIPGVW